MKVKFRILREGAKVPYYATDCAAGADICALSQEDIIIPPGQTRPVFTGIAVEIPEGYCGLIYARSGLACKKGLAPANKVGVIDSDYRGEITVYLHNSSSEERTLMSGERIAQMVITPYLRAEFEETDILSDTERGEHGFGSTGTK